MITTTIGRPVLGHFRAGFKPHALDAEHQFFMGRLPCALVLGDKQFEALWSLHPDEFPEIQMHGRLVKAPRWQQTFGKSYRFSGQTNKALPVPPILEPLLVWSRDHIDERLNGILVNWYDGALGHYIGRHRDSTINMVAGAPIVTISFGASRTFRVRPWKGKGFIDFSANNGSLFITPYDTNRAWTHEVLHRSRDTGRRISVTLRAFEQARGRQ